MKNKNINIDVSHTLLKVMSMDFAIAKISTKGQLVIPSSLRKNISAGDEFLIVKDKNRIILKNIKDVALSLKEDFIFSERVENAWKKFDQGKFKSKSKKDFLKELR